ncbi:bifunctional diaminohydroxyphosphoribosylaminopyrimidine deaminase/5-amino-6-(5-phosphoribosylamino)uracil reductase RibD [Lichenibacterium dinghuense]|uniref:bifunctional diaminohydroxyphosphoribosylaminopyrimidine deaminase/5-amino-6-(5-phosphoribosylamino)uracil reductase RibD n=1 Tax=Lichenibacterium dinghuense TaxID=2895977 RepID=UPI001F013780|nr:bifunctional diaminohydroxyphosphoribosylaminopyrimidine deaminase/5-amino-6-(5-phosphoribosylamino)uracil reductase RibD [Lichenibacterium sp. 6Y81]
MPFPDPTLPAPPAAPQDLASALRLAIDAASRFRGATAPNPTVGCCLLDAEGRVVALDAHRRAGTAHAEAGAIAQARAAGTVGRVHTVVVTLEPCDHHGRTPPCTEAILSTPARRVVVGAVDPNPAVAGGGAGRLARAGLDVLMADGLPGCAALADGCRALIAPFAKRATTGRPYVTVKQALDPAGSMIPPPGAKTFTSEPALRLAHALRRRADAVLTGSGTVLGDDPGFDVRRVPDHPGRRRQLAVLDRRGRVPAAWLERAASRNLDAFRSDDIGTALDRLGAAGALEVLVEAGPAVLESVAAAGLWDEWVVIRKGRGAAPDRAEVRRRGGAVETLELS